MFGSSVYCNLTINLVILYLSLCFAVRHIGKSLMPSHKPKLAKEPACSDTQTEERPVANNNSSFSLKILH